MYKALTVIALPVLNEDGNATGETVRFEPGQTITKAKMSEAGQTDEDVKNMTDAGSISEDMDAEICPDNRPVPPGATSLGAMVENAKSMVELQGDSAPPEIKALAELDYRSVNSGEAAKGASRGSR